MAQLTCPEIKKKGEGGGDGFSFLPFDFKLSIDGEVTTASLVLVQMPPVLHHSRGVQDCSAQAWILVSTMLATDTFTFPGPQVAAATVHQHKKAFRVFGS